MNHKMSLSGKAESPHSGHGARLLQRRHRLRRNGSRPCHRHTGARDLGLIGLDDSPVATQTHPRLTTIGYHVAAGARRLADVVPGTTT